MDSISEALKTMIMKPYYRMTTIAEKDLKYLNSVKNKNILFIGEAHDDPYCNWLVEEAIKIFKPDYFLTEHIQYTQLKNRYECLNRLRSLGNDGLPYNKFTKYWLNVWAKYDLPIIGMDYKPKNNKLSDFEKVVYNDPMPESFLKREDDMMKDIIKYSKLGRIIVQVGDTHLRAYKCKELGRGSPIRKFYNYEDNSAMIRIPFHDQEID